MNEIKLYFIHQNNRELICSSIDIRKIIVKMFQYITQEKLPIELCKNIEMPNKQDNFPFILSSFQDYLFILEGDNQ